MEATKVKRKVPLSAFDEAARAGHLMSNVMFNLANGRVMADTDQFRAQFRELYQQWDAAVRKLRESANA